MNLNKLVIDKIKQLGPTKAAAYFGVSVPTIYSWRQKNNAPVSAAQKVMDEEPEGAYTAPPGVPPPEAEVDPEVVPGEQAEPKLDDPEHMNIFEDHERRIAKLERWIVARTEGKVPTTSHVAPFTSHNSGMEIRSGVEIIGERLKPEEAPTNWNDPKKGDAPPKKGGGWNEPVKATQGRNPAHNWNAPLPPPEKKQAQ